VSSRPLESHTDVFAERNHFLFAWLGVVSAKRRLFAVLERQTRGPATPTTLEASHPFLLMLLGLASLSARAEAAARAWAAEADPAPPRVQTEPEPCLRRLLQ
jgi:hypothetical protein